MPTFHFSVTVKTNEQDAEVVRSYIAGAIDCMWGCGDPESDLWGTKTKRVTQTRDHASLKTNSNKEINIELMDN